MRKYIFVCTFCTLTALLLAACGGGGSSPPPSVPNTSSADGWTSMYSPGVTLEPVTGGLIAFALPATNANCPNGSYAGPTPCPQVDYVVTAANGLAPGKKITMTGSVTASPDAVFNHLTQPDGNQPGGHAAACRIWFEEAGDNLSGTGAYAYYRWWANDPADVVLANGPFSISAVLDPNAGGGWTSVMGEQANASPAATAGFAQAMTSAASMGFTCGGGSFYGHGVNMSAGSATFTLTSYAVQ